jgi:hypothetical protein
MAFVIKKRDSYRWTIEHALEKRQGKVELMSFDAEFKALPTSRIDVLLEQARQLKIDDVTFLGEILVAWHGLRAEDGAEFAYSAENLKQMLEEFPGITASLSRAWTESVLGGTVARKN